MKKRALFALLIALAAGGIALTLQEFRILDRIEHATWAWRVNFFSRRDKPSPDVQMILVDQESLDWGAKEMGWSWPWPREVYSLLLSFCRRGGAKGVAFDILFTEPSKYGVEDDRILGEAIRQTSNFVAAAFISTRKVNLPIPDVMTNAAVVATVSDRADRDGIFRRATLRETASPSNRPADSLGYALWKRANPGSDTLPPLDREGKLLLRFTGRDGLHRAWRAAAVLQSEMNLLNGEKATIDPSAVSNAHIIVGYSAPGLMDLRPTPGNRVLPGSEIHATVVDNLLTRRFLAPLPRLPSALPVLLLALLSALGTAFSKKSWQTGTILAAGPLTAILIGFLFYPAGFHWPLVTGLLSALLAGVGGILLNYAEEGRQKAFIKRAFRHYLGEDVINRMLENPSLLKLGGEKRELTIYFSDIEKFSSFSERLDPETLTALLNDYLSAMSRIIREEGGYLDKYIGDAVVAFWNAPLSQPDHAVRACRAAIRCQQALEERRQEWEEKTGAVIKARIGINTGEVVVGNMGSSERFNYTILGDNANLASRLEGANKAFGTYIMVSESTLEKTKGLFPSRELASIRVVGREKPVKVYELGIAPDGKVPGEWKAFERACGLFKEGRFAEAASCFRKWPDDPAARSYVRACGRYLDEKPQNWEGVWNLDQK